MSWNKNTIDYSNINAIIRVLKDMEEPYKVTVLGKVKGLGLNDEDDAYYELRRLEYKDKVILEKMIRISDCDMDDSIISVEYSKIDEPKKWKIEETIKC